MTHPIDEIMGNLLRRQRQGLALSQAQLAERLGLPLRTIIDAELGVARLSGRLLIQIAQLRPEPAALLELPAIPEGETGLLVGLMDSFCAIQSPTVRQALLALLQGDDGGGRGRHDLTVTPPRRAHGGASSWG